MNFDKNKTLEEALEEINNKLHSLEKDEMQKVESPKYPNLILLGNSRIGSTLFVQWLVSQNVVGYPSNFLSRLYKAPYLGALIFNLITKPEYQYRNEFEDINTDINFSSSIGKTKGFMSPHGFWYFWRRFIEHLPEEPMSEEEFSNQYNFKELNQELALLQKAFAKPFLLKGMILNSYIESLSNNLENAIIIHMHREPLSTVRSLMNARQKWYGNWEEWFSWKPREYSFLKDMDIYHQVAGQAYFIDKDILDKKHLLGNRYFSISYEDFCENPEKTFERLMNQIKDISAEFEIPNYTEKFEFKISNPVSADDDKMLEAYQFFENKYGKLKFD